MRQLWRHTTFTWSIVRRGCTREYTAGCKKIDHLPVEHSEGLKAVPNFLTAERWT
jgi:hypothetical protein